VAGPVENVLVRALAREQGCQPSRPAQALSPPSFFSSFAFFLFAFLSVCLDGLQIGPLAKLFMDYFLALIYFQ
jgi:hypothetical protein